MNSALTSPVFSCIRGRVRGLWGRGGGGWRGRGGRGGRWRRQRRRRGQSSFFFLSFFLTCLICLLKWMNLVFWVTKTFNSLMAAPVRAAAVLTSSQKYWAQFSLHCSLSLLKSPRICSLLCVSLQTHRTVRALSVRDHIVGLWFSVIFRMSVPHVFTSLKSPSVVFSHHFRLAAPLAASQRPTPAFRPKSSRETGRGVSASLQNRSLERKLLKTF